MQPLKKVDKDCGISVLKCWLFDLPELSYLTSIELIEKQKELSELKSEIERKRGEYLLLISNDKTIANQTIRDAEADRRVNALFAEKIKQANELMGETERLKAQRQYYDSIFKTVKDECYYQHRVKGLEDMKALSKAKASEVKRYLGGDGIDSGSE
jgi:hypothetical protein